MALEPGTKRSIGKDQTVRSGREESARADAKLPEATKHIHTRWKIADVQTAVAIHT